MQEAVVLVCLRCGVEVIVEPVNFRRFHVPLSPFFCLDCLHSVSSLEPLRLRV